MSEKNVIRCNEQLFVHAVEIRHLDELVRVKFQGCTAVLEVDIRPRRNDVHDPIETLGEIAARYPRGFSIRLGVLEGKLE